MALLRIDSSANTETCVTQTLSDRIMATLGPDRVITRDLAAEPLPQIDPFWTTARVTPVAERTAAQRDALALSNRLVAALQASDTVVIGLPVYNFSVPAALKAWIDLVARVGVTFQCSQAGPKGLLDGKRSIIALASGGTQAGSDIDFASGYLRHFLGFIGITDVTLISADQMAIAPEATLARANGAINELAKAA